MNLILALLIMTTLAALSAFVFTVFSIDRNIKMRKAHSSIEHALKVKKIKR